MSKYEELKAEVEKANQKRCTCSGFAVQYDGCSCENGKAESVALDRLHEFERGAAELIDAANKRIAELEAALATIESEVFELPCQSCGLSSECSAHDRIGRIDAEIKRVKGGNS